jgi:hypothetical protein
MAAKSAALNLQVKAKIYQITLPAVSAHADPVLSNAEHS